MVNQETKTTGAHRPIEQLSERVGELERALTDLQAPGASDRLAQANLDAVVKQLNDLTANVEAIAKHLKHSAGYRLRDTYECDKCHSRGHAAVRVTCTVCNRQSWLGWFPSEANNS